MKRGKLIFFLIVISVVLLLKTSFSDNPPAQNWNVTYGGVDAEVAYSIQQTSDGGYVVAGYTATFGQVIGNNDVWVVKLNSTGGIVWNMTYGGAGTETFYSIQQTSDGNYVSLGITDSFGVGDFDIWIIKTNSTGGHTWNSTYGGIGVENAYSIQQTSDSWYITTGYTTSFGAGSNDFWVIKLNSTGGLVWNSTFGGTGSDIARSVQQTSDGGYIVAGQTDSYGAGLDDFWVIKLNSTGDQVWNSTYGGGAPDIARSIQQTSDGGYIVTGETNSGVPGTSFWIIKINSTGGQTWGVTYEGPINVEKAYSIQQTSDEGYIIVGETSSFGAGSNDFWLIKTNSTGGHTWNSTYGGTGGDIAYSIVNTSDSGYVVAGVTTSFGAGGNDFWIIKLNGTGEGGDTTPPSLSTVYPQNITYNTNVSSINYTIGSDSQACWYSVNNGGTNTSVACGTNLTGLTSNEGSNTWLVAANDSSNNKNSSIITFVKDTIKPNLTINSPTNTTYNTRQLLINLTNSSDTQAVWWYNGTANLTYSLVYYNLSEGSRIFFAYANDSAGNINQSSISFVVDITTPNLSSISSSSITTSSATITWITGELANSTVFYGTTIGTTLNSTNSTLTTSHSFTISNLGSSTLYYYNVSSCDSAGNCNTSTQSTFTTLAIPPPSGSGGGGSICVDECGSGKIEKTCSNSSALKTKTCGNYDYDSCLEWGSFEYLSCEKGCANGNCIINLTESSPKLKLELIFPEKDIAINQHQVFNVSFNLTCLYADCGSILLSLDPASPPRIKLTSPRFGQSYSNGESVSVTADARGSEFPLNCSLYVDDIQVQNKKFNDWYISFSFAFNNNYRVNIVCKDKDGDIGQTEIRALCKTYSVPTCRAGETLAPAKYDSMTGCELQRTCVSVTCTSGWKCQSNSYKGYQSTSCQWVNVSYCQYGCLNGACKPAPQANIPQVANITNQTQVQNVTNATGIQNITDVTAAANITATSITNQTTQIENITNITDINAAITNITSQLSQEQTQYNSWDSISDGFKLGQQFVFDNDVYTTSVCGSFFKYGNGPWSDILVEVYDLDDKKIPKNAVGTAAINTSNISQYPPKISCADFSSPAFLLQNVSYALVFSATEGVFYQTYKTQGTSYLSGSLLHYNSYAKTWSTLQDRDLYFIINASIQQENITTEEIEEKFEEKPTAYWTDLAGENLTRANITDVVKLIVENAEEFENLSFEIWEDDFLWFDDIIKTNQTDREWRISLQDYEKATSFELEREIEFYFKVLVNGEEIAKSQVLKVDKKYPEYKCGDDKQVIIKISEEEFGLAELYNQQNFKYELCYDDIFGEKFLEKEGEDVYSCRENNKILSLSNTTSALSEVPSFNNYKINVCFGNLECKETKENCLNLGENYKQVISLTQESEARVSYSSNKSFLVNEEKFPVRICCKIKKTIEEEKLYWEDMAGNLISTASRESTIKLIWQKNITKIEFKVYKEGLVDSLKESITPVLEDNKLVGEWKAQQGKYYFVAEYENKKARSGVLEVSGKEENKQPVAVIANPAEGSKHNINQEIFFMDGSYDADDDYSVEWNFGDGSKAGLENCNLNECSASHSYNETGKKTITLTATDARGLKDSKTRTIHISKEKGLITAIKDDKPFYLMSGINPLTLNLAKDESKIISWQVNATGSGLYTIFAYANLTNSNISSSSNAIDVTIEPVTIIQEKIIEEKATNITKCPQISPPRCKSDETLAAGGIDDKGCRLPSKCVPIIHNVTNVTIQPPIANITNVTIITNITNITQMQNITNITQPPIENITNITQIQNVTITANITNITTDTTPPVITLISPANNSQFSSGNKFFTFKAVDDSSQNLNCSLYISNSLKNLSFVGNNIEFSFEYYVSSSWFSRLFFPRSNWKIECRDESSNTASSETRYFYLVSSVICPSFSQPKCKSDEQFIPEGVDDNNCQLPGKCVVKNVTVIQNITNVTIPIIHNVTNVTQIQNVTNITQPSIQNITMDTKEPRIILISPLDNYSAILINTSSTNITFSFSVSDENKINSCKLILNNLAVTTDVSITENMQQEFIKLLSTGNYTWQVNCSDEAGNQGNSSARKLFINRQVAGCVSNWSCVNVKGCKNHIQNQTCIDLNKCLAAMGKAEKSFCNNLPKAKKHPDAEKLIMKPGTAEFNVSVDDEDNDSVIITWKLDNLKEEEEESYSYNFSEPGNYTLNVSISDSFNIISFAWEIQVLNLTCIENWQCSWRDCKKTNGEYYSVPDDCEDLNDCGTENFKPGKTACSLNNDTGELTPIVPISLGGGESGGAGGGGGGGGCSPKFECRNWSECLVNYSLQDLVEGKSKFSGFKERACIDKNSCFNPRIEKEECILNVPVEAKKIKFCNEDYVEVYEKATGKLVSRVKETGERIDISFVSGISYCDYCYNKVKDYDEEAVDCGGSCKECKEEEKTKAREISGKFFDLVKYLLWLLFLILAVVYLHYLRKEGLLEAGKEKIAGKIETIKEIWKKFAGRWKVSSDKDKEKMLKKIEEIEKEGRWRV